MFSKKTQCLGFGGRYYRLGQTIVGIQSKWFPQQRAAGGSLTYDVYWSKQWISPYKIVGFWTKWFPVESGKQESFYALLLNI